MESIEKKGVANRVAVRGKVVCVAAKPLLHEHDPAWLVEAQALGAIYQAVLRGLLLAIEHVGSTAVPRLLAKPILDIDLVISSRDDLPAVSQQLGAIGYSHHGDQGIPGREVFKRANENVPITNPSRRWTHHHLYVCAEGAEELRRHLRFRDLLRSDADVRNEYQQLKVSIAARCGGDRKQYAALKELEGRGFFERILGQA